LAKLAHQVLGLRHYSQSDFIVSPHGVYLLEVNTLPRLTEKSLYPKSLEAIGSSLKEFSGHLVNLALNK
jgi:D-alanine-D-alanine ligase